MSSSNSTRTGPLTDREVRTLPTGKHFDTGGAVPGLYLHVYPTGARHWRLRYKLSGVQRVLSLGTYMGPPVNGKSPSVQTSLAEARRQGELKRRMLLDGQDPLEVKKQQAAATTLAREKAEAELAAHRRAEREKKAAVRRDEQARSDTFGRVSDEWIERERPRWSLKHCNQVIQCLRDHALPLRDRPIAEVTSGEVMDQLTALCNQGQAETARRLYQRIHAVLTYALHRQKVAVVVTSGLAADVRRLREGAFKIKPREHFPALPIDLLPGFLRALDSYGGDPIAKAATRLLLLTGVRTSELRLARWNEFAIDGDSPAWTIPADRMKVKRRDGRKADDHRVPLSSHVVKLLLDLRELTLRFGWVFPQSRRPDRPLSENSVLSVLNALGYGPQLTEIGKRRALMSGHGMRQLFATWAYEQGFDANAIERQLDHAQPSRVIGAYNHAKHWPVRQQLMQSWSSALEAMGKGETAKVLPLTPKRSRKR